MPKYNLLEYSDKYCIDVKDNVSDSRSFKYKTRITRRTEVRPSKSGNEEILTDQTNTSPNIKHRSHYSP